MQRNITTKAMVEGAMLLGILIVLSLLVILPTPVALFSFVLLPTPILFAVFRHNIKLAIMVGFLSVILLVIVGINPISALINGIYATFLGIALGYGFVKRLKPTTTLLITALALLLSIILIYYLSASFLGLNMLEETLDIQIELMENIAQRMQEARPPGEGSNDQFIPFTREQIRYIFPGMLVLASIVNAFFTISVIRIILKKFGIKTEGFPKFSNWRFGEWLLWTFIGAVVMRFVPQLAQIGENLLQIAFYGIILQGLAVI